MDEPLSNLDANSESHALRTAATARTARNNNGVCNTRSGGSDDAGGSYGGDGLGQIAASDAPIVYRNPANALLPDLLCRPNLLRGEVVDGRFSVGDTEFTLPLTFIVRVKAMGINQRT